MYILIFSTTFVIPRRIQRDIINGHRSSCKVAVLLFTFQSNSNFLDKFSESIQMSYFMISIDWEPSCSMRTDGQTDRHDEANSRFLQFCERA